MSEMEQVASQEGETEEREYTTVEELLITCVEARPALWDSRLPLKNRSKTTRDLLWLEIYREFGENAEFSVEFLQKKWRGLRDTYVRLKGEYTPSGSGAKKKKKWEFFDSLMFLSDTINYRPTISNIEVPSTSLGSDTPPLMSPTFSDDGNKNRKQSSKIEGAILEALEKVNTPVPCSDVPAESTNPICLRISELLKAMPQGPRTLLEIKLLQVAYEGSKEYIN